VTTWFADLAWLGGAGLAAGVVLEDGGDGRLARVATRQDPPAGAVHLPGIVVPGLANAHSHVFHRALRGRAQAAGAGDFWRWRDRMYALAAVLDPDGLFDLARATYAEMALAGVTLVGEFHYLHHRPDGRPYGEPNAMGEALVAAAGEAGVRLTLLDACYLRAGFGEEPPLAGAQVRFTDGDAEGWAGRVDALAPPATPADPVAGGRWLLGAAVHSVRAVDGRSMAVVADWAERRGAPLHLHLSEQPAENEQALAATGRTPTGLAEDAGVLGPRTVAVHATHPTDGDVKTLGTTGTGVCLCPSTERDLGDGVGPAARLVAAGCPLSLGSDSHAVIDLFEEARLVELHQRLVSLGRGIHPVAALLAAATSGGYRALGWAGDSDGDSDGNRDGDGDGRGDGNRDSDGDGRGDGNRDSDGAGRGDGNGRVPAGALAEGAPADFVVLDRGSVRLAGLDPDQGAAGVVYAATAADVTDVVVGGRTVVRDRAHVTIPDVAGALDRSITSLWSRVTP
jgi:formiminoglutamate deiminase